MQLFKRILLSLFPEEIINQTVNPASMFVSFINAKQFFSVVNRKIVENYKLNLFDISLDPFEVKIGFGETPTIKVKDVDFYYGYAATANFNGYRFFSPSNIATGIALITSIYTKDVFAAENSEKKDQFFLYFLCSVYLLTFIFQARLKVFPYGDDDKANYGWFIDVFFSFYGVVLEQAGLGMSQERFDALKQKLLQNIQLFFMLYYVYKSVSECIQPHQISEKEFYGWLFYDELKKGDYQPLVQDFVEHAHAYTRHTEFNATEKKVMHLVLPADILLRYLLETDDIFLVTETFASAIYDKDRTDSYLRSFLTSGEKLAEFLLFITDYTHYKKNYFPALKKYILRAVKQKPQQHQFGEKDIDELLSSIGDAGGELDNVQIPQHMRKEAEIMEKMMNFYVTFVGGFWVARGDNFYLRLCKPDLLNIVSQPLPGGIKQDAIYYYWGLLYHYSKNVFYYKYAFENIRAGKDKFHLPFRATFREVYSNMFIIKLFDTHAFATLLQDINPRDTKIYVKNKRIVELFRDYFSEGITSLLRAKNWALTEQFYKPLVGCVADVPAFAETLTTSVTSTERENLKENLYTIDVQVFQYFLQQLEAAELHRKSKYSDYSILGILASIKDTLTGFLLYYTFILYQEDKENISLDADLLLKIYIIDVLNITEEYYPFFAQLFDSMAQKRKPLRELRIWIDDNESYFHIGYENRKYYTQHKSAEDIMGGVAGEDIIRLRWYLKNIRYYNIRFLIPQA